MPSRSVVGELVARIRSRENLYRVALRGDLALMRREHGREPVRQALAKLGARDGIDDEWDQLAHAKAVRKGVARLMRERRQRAEDLPLPPVR